jgi:superfamily I DNA/RNA helicase
MWAMHGDAPAFDLLLFDEAQDAWPAVSEAILRMKIPTIYVGDPFQQIYGFRGAVDALGAIQAPALTLTKSWRFGPEIAALATNLLGIRPTLGLEKPAFRLYGNETRDSHWETQAEGTPQPLLDRGTFAVICRTNAGILETALKTGKDVPIHIVGGGSDVYDQILDAFRIWAGKVAITSELRRIKNWQHFEEAAQTDFNLKMAKKMVDDHKAKLPSIVENLRARTVDSERKAEIVFSSIHRAKGREWDEVVIGDDVIGPAEIFRKTANSLRTGRAFDRSKTIEEMNLNYVAVTRAKLLLRMPQSLSPEFAMSEIKRIDEETARRAKETAGQSAVFRKLAVGRDQSIMSRGGWS